MNNEALDYALETFAQTIRLKLQQFHAVVGKGTNNDLSGKFIEELVRGFIRGWISPCRILSGTLHPFNFNPEFEADPWAPQIDGIIFDPRQGLPMITEGDFLVAHPAVCPGVIEIKKSENDLQSFEARLTKIHKRFFCRSTMAMKTPCWIMGIVIHDPDPEAHSCPKWQERPLYDGECNMHCPIFILFKEVQSGVEYDPYEPGIKAMIQSIFNREWALDPPLSRLRRDRTMHQIQARHL